MIRIFPHPDDVLREQILAHSDAEALIFVQLVQQDFIPKLELFFTPKHLLIVIFAARPQIKAFRVDLLIFVQIRSLFGVKSCWTTSDPVGPPHLNAFGYPNVQGNKCAKSEFLKIGHPLEALDAST